MAKENPSRPKKTLSKISKLSPRKKSVHPKVVEQVPDWLRMLLGKYGEAQGNLTGLQEDPGAFDEDFSPLLEKTPAIEVDNEAESAELSALLEQMAEDGPMEPSANQLSTSVEWGTPPPLNAPDPESDDAIDDILSGLGDTQDTPVDTPAPWVTEDALTYDLDVDDVEFDKPHIEQPGVLPAAAIAATEQNIPDWLSDDLETVDAEKPRASQPSPATDTSADIPDWLTDALDTTTSTERYLPPPPPLPKTQTTSDDFEAPPTQQEVEIPDWLSEMTPPAAMLATEQPLASVENKEAVDNVTDWDVPDWINDKTPETEKKDNPLIESPFTDLPVDEIEPDDIPDWLKPTQETTTEPTFDSVEPDEPALNWLDIADETPSEPSSADDQLESSESPPDDWLNRLDTPPSSDQTPATETSDIDLPDWLTEIEELTSTEKDSTQPKPLQTDEAEADNADWMTGLRAAVPAAIAATEDPPLEREEEDIQLPDWLSEDATPSSEKQPASTKESIIDDEQVTLEPVIESTETDLEEIPDWLSEMTEPDDTSTSMADDYPEEADDSSRQTTSESREDVVAWLANLSTPVESSEPPAEIEADVTLPEWAAETLESTTPPELLTQSELEEQSDEEQSGASIAAIAGVAGTIAATAALDNLQETSQPDEPEATEEKDTATAAASLLVNMPESSPPLKSYPTGQETSDDEIPDWLAEIPAALPPEDSTDTQIETLSQETEDAADWLADLQKTGTAAGTDFELDDDVPDWLLESPEDQPDMPDWLADEAAEPEALPDWMAATNDTPGIPVIDTLPAEEKIYEAGPETPPETDSLAATITDFETEEVETADWLSRLPQIAEIPETEEPVDDEEMPDWLADLPKAAVTGQLSLSKPGQPVGAVAEVDDIEMPDWLADLPAVPADDALETGTVADGAAAALNDFTDSFNPTDEITAAPDTIQDDKEDETPDWLIDLPDPVPTETADTITEAEDDDGFPDWLAVLPESIETPDKIAGDEDDDDLPDWLAELSPDTTTVETYQETDQSDKGDDETPEPAKTTDETIDFEMKEGIPDWLADSPEIVETPAGSIFDQTEDDESLNWPANETDQDDQPELTVPLVETEDETPDWLTDLPDPATQDVPHAKDDSEDIDTATIVAGLAGVGGAIAAATAIDSSKPDDTDDDMPDWPADLRPSDTVTDAEAENDLPDWMSEDQRPEENLDTESKDEAIPDWLADTDLTIPPETPDGDDSVELDETASNWLAGLSIPDKTENKDIFADSESLVDNPDWLTGLPPSDSVTETDPATENSDDMPDWLANLHAIDETSETTSQTDSEDALPDWLTDNSIDQLDTPDWLLDPLDTDTETPESTGETKPETDEEDSTGVAAAAITGAAGAVIAAKMLDSSIDGEIDEEQAKTPDWLTDLPKVAHDSPTNVETVPDTSDRLIDMPTSTVQTTDRETLTEDTTEEGSNWQPIAPPSALSAADEEHLPDWLAELPPTDETTDFSDDAGTDKDTPDWLTDLPELSNEEIPATTETTSSESLNDDDLIIPDWLGQTSLDDIDTPHWLLDDDDVQDNILTPPLEPEASDATTEESGDESTTAKLSGKSTDQTKDIPDDTDQQIKKKMTYRRWPPQEQ